MASRACLAATIVTSRGSLVSAFSNGRSSSSSTVSRTLSTINNRGVSSVSSRTAIVGSGSPFYSSVFANNVRIPVGSSRSSINSIQLQMSSTEAKTTTTTPKRVKTNDAQVSDEPVAIKGWVRTVRKQKTLAFVEVNDGSSMSGIQCVLPFDDVDEDTMKGMCSSIALFGYLQFECCLVILIHSLYITSYVHIICTHKIYINK